MKFFAEHNNFSDAQKSVEHFRNLMRILSSLPHVHQDSILAYL